MRCPKCGYISFDHLDQCQKCRTDLSRERIHLNLLNTPANPISLLAMIPDAIGELSQENIAPQIWDAINDMCALTRSLAGEKGAPENPKVCEFCGTANDPSLESCAACGAALPSDLPRKCPKCGRGHTSEALFCQACGTRLVEG